MSKANNTAEGGFEVYKGLQAPLMFKGFKGRFIYIGGAFVVGGFMVAAVFLSSVGTIPGLVSLCLIWGFGFVYITQNQKKGLHAKKNKKGIFIVVNKYKLRKLD